MPFPGQSLCKPGYGLGRASRNHTAGTPDELSIEEGDELDLQEHVDDQYLRVSLEGRTGLVPVSAVDIIVDIPPLSAGFDRRESRDGVGSESTGLATTPGTPQNTLSPSTSSSLLAVPWSPVGRPTNAVEELIHTEHGYLESLRQVRDEFFPKLRAHVTASEASTLFHNWAEIIVVSQVCALSYAVYLCPPDLVHVCRGRT